MTPAMRVNCFSSGVATDAAITSGLAPGRPALTMIVGKSTSGSGRDRQQRIGDPAGQRQGRPAAASWQPVC